ncbi:MAG: calcium-translocating P-type ATPase, PMCA-type [Clostridia bacterium]|nr:calcium-translocating P-type ATPase, PMCA-type [Clostridia bacterium]
MPNIQQAVSRTVQQSLAASPPSRTAMEGLSAAEVAASRRAHGENRLTRQKSRGFWSYFAENLKDPVIRILLIALCLNLALTFRGGDWVETVGIAVSVALATLISTLSECRSEQAFSRLQAKEVGRVCRVLRADGVTTLPWDEVVVGDLICIGAGENVPADGVLLRGEVWVDQAAMTGESREVHKRMCIGKVPADMQADDACSLFRGSAVLRGEGVLRVRAVGDATVLGGISREVQSEVRESPLRLRLAKLARQISVVGYVAAALVAAAYLFDAFLADSGFSWEVIRLKLGDLPYLATNLLHALMLGLTVIVVAVPEGLPMMIAVVLSANTRRMVRDQVLVRKPAGIEAAGSMNLLFTDKTGTLTEGKLGVGEILTCEREYEDASALFERREPLSQLFALSCRENSAAQIGRDGNPVGGNATEVALLTVARQGSVPSVATVLWSCPFDSERKFSACALRLRDGRELTLIKGAPERILRCVRAGYRADGGTVGMSGAAMQRQIEQRAGKGERFLVMAVAPSALPQTAVRRGVFDGAAFLCAVRLCDRLRPEAPRAVRALQRAGVQVVMITGDAVPTATAIAQRCGLLRDGQSEILSGEQLAVMSDDEVRARLPRLAVVARARPCDKSRLVRLAQEENRVVGMTGDGVNDAPALRLADIGFSMGSGSDVAKDAGDIIILDNDLASIVNAVLYGRTIFKSIRKFITLQLTMNFCAVGVSMIGPFIGVDAPVTVVQMLWINLIMDTLGGLAFAGEAPLRSYLEQAPNRRDTPILCRYMIDQIALLGGYTVALCIFFLKNPWIRAQFRGGQDDLCHLTAFFALFIFASVFNCFNARSDRRNPLAGLRKNRAFCGIMLLILLVQIIFVYLGGTVLRTVPLTARELALTAAMALSVLPFEQLRKQLWRWRGYADRF